MLIDIPANGPENSSHEEKMQDYLQERPRLMLAVLDLLEKYHAERESHRGKDRTECIAG